MKKIKKEKSTKIRDEVKEKLTVQMCVVPVDPTETGTKKYITFISLPTLKIFLYTFRFLSENNLPH